MKLPNLTNDIASMDSPRSILEKLYDTYGAMLYGIALEISSTPQAAEETLAGTFQKLFEQKPMQPGHPSLCARLIQLTIQTAREQLKPMPFKNRFRLKQFESTPILHELLCGQISLENYCKDNQLTRIEAGKKIRNEYLSLRDPKNEMIFPLKTNYQALTIQ